MAGLVISLNSVQLPSSLPLTLENVLLYGLVPQMLPISQLWSLHYIPYIERIGLLRMPSLPPFPLFVVPPISSIHSIKRYTYFINFVGNDHEDHFLWAGIGL